MSKELGITPRGENFAEWYNDLVKRSELAENSPVRGSMVIRPHGYALWENMQRALDDMFKATGHVNAYFPLLIPKSFLAKEAEHVQGFAKECAIVTHHRLIEKDGGLEVDPDSKLEEEYIIRPTSETVIWHTYKNWIQSYRDLPLLINQWANVMRWELRPRLFLRTTEFLWQEGHTAHATFEEAEQEALTILNDCYARFAEEWMAVPVLKGLKSENEKFPGADHTYCIEALVQDGRAIQAGTSHHLGQNFAKAFDVKFQSKEGKLELVYATSWGVSTRLVGTLVMAHGDDKGLVLPPKLAPVQVVVIPIGKGDGLEAVLKTANALAGNLIDAGVRVKVDDSDKSPGWKYNEWELKGACVRLELGPRDLEAGQCVVARRDEEGKHTIQLDMAVTHIVSQLTEMQKAIFDRALAFRDANTHRVDSWDDFKKAFDGEGGGGFVLAHWDGTTETELAIKAETNATIRVIPSEPLHDDDAKPGACVFSGKPSKQRVVFAKAY
jgi:prolyl-tRNA synthetase